MARESLIAARLGLTELTDAVLLFLTLPDFLVSLLLIGGINAALIPALKSGNDNLTNRLLGNSIILVIIFTLALGAFFAISPSTLISILAPSLNFEHIPNFEHGLQILPWIVLSACFIALINAVLFSSNRFYIVPLTVALFNILIIIYFYFLDLSSFSIVSVSYIFLLAISIRLFLLLLPVAPTVRHVKFGALHEQKKYWRIFIIGFISFGMFAIAPTAFRSVYAGQGDGFLAIFNLANKLFELPMGLIVGTISTILLPYASGLVVSENKEYEKIFVNILRATFTLAVISLLLTLLFVTFYVQLLFEYGVLEAIDTARISLATKTMFIGAPFAAVSLILIVNLNARNNAKIIILCLAPSLLISLLFANAKSINTFGLDQAIAGLNLFYLLSCSCLMFFSFPKMKQLKTVINLCTLDVIPIILISIPLFLFTDNFQNFSTVTGVFLSIATAAGLCAMKWKLFWTLSNYKIQT